MNAQKSSYIDDTYPLSALTGKVIAAAQRVHHELGPGFMEVICQRALALELPAHEVDFNREVEIVIHYRGQRVGKQRVDYLISDQTGSVMLELKAKAAIEEGDFVRA